MAREGRGKILKQLNNRCLIHQPNYSMLDRWIEDGLLDVLEKEGIGCIAFCPLAQGLLTDKYLKGIPKDSRAAKPSGFLQVEQVTEKVIKKVAELKKIAEKRGQTIAQMALAWVLSDERVTSALIGASRPEQIEENVKALDNLDFTEKELSQIDGILKK
jgi:L-glyceraldehyde 3-phosphate reductase